MEVSIPLLILSLVASLFGLVCAIFVIVAAFKDEAWKGIVCFFCGFYLLYYALVEYDEENKTWVVGGLILSAIVAAIARVAIGAPVPH